MHYVVKCTLAPSNNSPECGKKGSWMTRGRLRGPFLLMLMLYGYVSWTAGPVQPCRGFGTLFVPKYVDFRKQLTYEDGQTSCKNLLGVIPTTEQSQSECAKNMAKRMQTLFKLADLPVIWTSDASDKSGTQRVLCYAGKPYSRPWQCSFQP